MVKEYEPIFVEDISTWKSVNTDSSTYDFEVNAEKNVTDLRVTGSNVISTLDLDDENLGILFSQGEDKIEDSASGSTTTVPNSDLEITLPNGASITVLDFFKYPYKTLSLSADGSTYKTYNFSDFDIEYTNVYNEDTTSVSGSIFNDVVDTSDSTSPVTINTGAGDDTIKTGSTNDTIIGGVGTNTYNFKAGDGKDTIKLTKGEVANLVFEDISTSSLKYEIKGKDLVITYNTNYEDLTQFTDGDGKWYKTLPTPVSNPTTVPDPSLYTVYDGNAYLTADLNGADENTGNLTQFTDGKWYETLPTAVSNPTTVPDPSLYTVYGDKAYLTADLNGNDQKRELGTDTVTLKGYASSEIANEVLVNGTSLSGSALVYKTELTTNKFTGTRFIDEVVVKENDKITKGVKINAGAGNNKITGSNKTTNVGENQFLYGNNIYNKDTSETANKVVIATVLKDDEIAVKYSGDDTKSYVYKKSEIKVVHKQVADSSKGEFTYNDYIYKEYTDEEKQTATQYTEGETQLEENQFAYNGYVYTKNETPENLVVDAAEAREADPSNGEFEYDGYIYEKNSSAKEYIEVGNRADTSKGEFEYDGVIYKQADKVGTLVVYNTGNDTIVTGSGNDTITGGTGNDTLTGGSGTNTYNFTYGDGNDTIKLTKGEIAKIVIKDSLGSTNSNNLLFEIKGKDLIVHYNNTANEGEAAQYADSITLKGYSSGEIAKDVLINGRSISSELLNLPKELSTSSKYTGTRFNDTITVNSESSKITKGVTINSGAGNDVITGSNYRTNATNDQFVYGGYVYDISRNTKEVQEQSLVDDTHVRVGVYVYDITGLTGKTIDELTEEDYTTNENSEKVVDPDKYTLIGKKYYSSDSFNGDLEGNRVSEYKSEVKADSSKGEFEYDGKIYNTSDYVSKMKVLNTGNDKINAGAGDDKITGGTGNDTLTGGSGNNTYYFSVGDGKDIINLTSKEVAKLEIDGVSASDIKYEMKGKDVVLSYGSSDTITLKNYVSKDIATVYINGEDLANHVYDAPVTKSKVSGTRLSENFDIQYGTSGKKGATINTGAGNDIITSGVGNDTINVNGSGTKTINVDVGSGDDVLNITSKTAKTILDFNKDSALYYQRSGNDLIVQFNTDVQYQAKGTISGTINGVEIPTDSVFTIDEETGLFSLKDGEKTILSLTLDNLKKAKDGTYTLTDTENSIDLKLTKLKIYKVLNGEEKDITTDYFSSTTSVTDDGVEYNKSLLASEVSKQSDSLTIKNYFKTDGSSVYLENLDKTLADAINASTSLSATLTEDYTEYEKVNSSVYSHYLLGDKDATTSQTLKGTFLNEVFIDGNYGDKIYTGAGDDIVNGGAGNDIIYLNGAGVKRMKFTDGSGKDTVNMNTSGVDAKINFGDNAKVSYTIDNNSLNVNHSYTKDGVTSDNTVVLNNLFSNKTDSSLTVGNDVLTVGKEQVTKKSTRNLLQVSDSTKTNFDITGSKNADHIITGAGNDVISSGKGNDIVNAGDGNNTLVYTSGVDNYTAGNGDDTYNVNFGKSTDLVITDNGGNDVLNLLGKGLSSDNLSLLFNVTKSTTEPIDSESSLFIFDNSKFTTKNVLSMVSNDHASGSVSLENYFTTGKIETVNVGSDAETATTWDFSTKINQITQAVQSWLNDYGYVDAMEVFESKNSTDMSSLLNVYSTGSYTSTQTAEQQVLPTT